MCPSSAKVISDLLIIKIGNIPPKKEIKIIFSFLQTLDISLNKKLKFILPLVLTPRYIPLEKTLNLLKDFIFKGKINVEKFNSMRKAGNIYKMRMKIIYNIIIILILLLIHNQK